MDNNYIETEAEMREVTAAQLRDMVADAIAPTIELHRTSRVALGDDSYTSPDGSPTDEEIDEFLCHNSLLDEETVEQLIDPGFLGFFAKTAHATEEWLEEFQENLRSWAKNHSWLAADLPWRNFVLPLEPNESTIWTPTTSLAPGWISTAPACLLIAADLLREGRLLSEMEWRNFEELIGALLEAEGWNVKVTQPSRDGGLDVLATKFDSTLGEIRSVWQAKKYSPANKVKLSEVRELSAIREEQRATKGLIVTTSRLTRDALSWVKRDIYRLGYKEHNHVKRWIEGAVLGIPSEHVHQ